MRADGVALALLKKKERDKDLKQNVRASKRRVNTTDWRITHGQPQKV